MTTSSLSIASQLMLGNIPLRAAHRTPEKIAFVDRSQAITYARLQSRISQLAGWLQKNGVHSGEKAAFILKNSVSFVEVFFATTLTGGVGVPINFRLSAREFVYILNQSDSRILFIDAEYAEMIQSLRGQIPGVEKVIVVGQAGVPCEGVAYEPYESLFAESESALESDSTTFIPNVVASDEDDCVIIYTSGTTGQPKGAVLSHKNLYVNAMNLVWELECGSDFRQLVIPPLFHIAALATMIFNCIISGTSFIHREFSPVEIMKTIEQEKINAMFLVPAMWNFLLQGNLKNEYDLSSIRKCITGGAICPLEVKRRILAAFSGAGIYDAFGQTETSPVVTCLHPEDALRRPDSVGKAVINVEIRVVDDEMQDVPVGKIGEAVYRGPVVMKEYYRNEKATRDAFYGGWFHSGDLVRQDEEGFLFVVDRKKDMIISGGENIYPAEVEEVFYLHPGVLEAAVVGMADEQWGEAVKAFVVLKPGTAVSEAELIAHCQNLIASYKKPRVIEFVDALPRNAAGKILKRVLREQKASMGRP
jgi:fatty-acyl-CoA synthase